MCVCVCVCVSLSLYIYWSLCGVVANVFDCDIVVSSNTNPTITFTFIPVSFSLAKAPLKILLIWCEAKASYFF